MFSIGNNASFNGRKPLFLHQHDRQLKNGVKNITYPLFLTSTDLYRVFQLCPPKEHDEKVKVDYCGSCIDPYFQRFIVIDIKNWTLCISNDDYCTKNMICYDIKRHLSKFINFESGFAPLSVFVRFVKTSFTCVNPGCILLFPTTGDTFYWEDINCLRLFHEMNNCKGFLHVKLPLSSVEKCVNLTMIEPAGFMVITTFGRLFHLYPRDDMRELKLVYQTLPLGGSILHFQSIISKMICYPYHIVAVRAGSIKGAYERLVYGLFSNADIYIWEIFRKGKYQLLQKKNIRDLILKSSRLDGSTVNRCEFLDFSICNWDPYSLVCLITWHDNASRWNYAVASVSFSNEMIPEISHFHKIRSYPSLAASVSARILHPYPGTVIYCVFDLSLVILHKVREKNTSYFVEETLFTNSSCKKFQIINVASVDAVFEHGNNRVLKFPALHLMTKGNGIISIESTNCLSDEFNGLNFLRSRLSQYAMQNPLFKNQFSLWPDFSSALPESKLFPTLLSLCDEVSISYPDSHTSVSEVLNYQFQRLMEMILVSMKYLKLTATEQLKLWLKLAYVNSLVDIYGQLTCEDPKNNILHSILQAMTASGNIEDLFLKKSLNLNLLLHLLHTFCKRYANTKETFNLKLVQIMITVNNVFGMVFGNELAYRQEKVIKYVDPTTLFLSELCNLDIENLTLLSTQIMESIALDQKYILLECKDPRDNTLRLKLQKQILHLIEHICLLVHVLANAIQNSSTSESAAEVQHFNIFEVQFRNTRKTWLTYLAHIGYLERAISISEHVQDFHSLVALLNFESIEKQQDKIKKQKLYIEKYKDKFATVLFTHMIETGQIHSLLHDFRCYQTYLRNFFETNKLHNFLWVYEAELGNFAQAADILLRDDSIKKSKVSQETTRLALSKLFTLTNKSNCDDNYMINKNEEG
ncbi:nucleoporin Nup131 [Schizosaccharomyces cryophilus OY26]|uniref:Nucleoporin Nup131 n=1 Tax=Schizosaccharomyces cryophilus (strain OY26 / ATCC MYA-4695 / CBS 11777 / NBRC 106824 / NRRL Y48691) TaxID=653667 RepID=S9XB03_SCHCR|nr:nucleoporin Nup131 [Schizosaccharomyces cryophilus OY26]EPY54312.1 nucleoporin Nup131 [Schizosaccharomyces cryophilus OY26]